MNYDVETFSGSNDRDLSIFRENNNLSRETNSLLKGTHSAIRLEGDLQIRDTLIDMNLIVTNLEGGDKSTPAPTVGEIQRHLLYQRSTLIVRSNNIVRDRHLSISLTNLVVEILSNANKPLLLTQ